MKLKIRGMLCVALTFLIVLACTACQNTKEYNYIDNSVYFEDTIVYNTSTSSTNTTASLKNGITGDTGASIAFTKIQISGVRKWIASMYIEKVEFTFTAPEDCVLDLQFKITNVQSTNNFDSSEDEYYYLEKSSLSLVENKPTTICFAVKDTISSSKNPVFTVYIDDTVYVEHPSLAIQMNDFKVYGEHIK